MPHVYPNLEESNITFVASPYYSIPVAVVEEYVHKYPHKSGTYKHICFKQTVRDGNDINIKSQHSTG